jgi:hypothetical protein
MKNSQSAHSPNQPKPYIKPRVEHIRLRPEDRNILNKSSGVGSESVFWDTSKPLPEELEQELAQVLAKYKDNNTQ